MRNPNSNHVARVKRQDLLFEGSVLPLMLVLLVSAGVAFSTGLLNAFGILTPGGNPDNLETSIGFLLTAVFGYLALQLRKADNVRSVKFYDEYFVARMRDVNLRITYPEVENVKKSSEGVVDSIFGPRMTIKLKGRTSPLTFHGYSKNKRLRMDLYSWLLEKSVGEQQVSGSVRGV